MHALLCDVRGDDDIDSRPGQWTLLATVRLVGRHWAAVDTGTGAGHAHDHTALGKWQRTCLNPRQQQLLNSFSSASAGPAICARLNRADLVSDTPDYQLPGADLRHSHGHQVAARNAGAQSVAGPGHASLAADAGAQCAHVQGGFTSLQSAAEWLRECRLPALRRDEAAAGQRHEQSQCCRANLWLAERV